MYPQELASSYDLIYQLGGMKDYPAEATAIAELIRQRHPQASTLLDVGCGTGLHLATFAGLFTEVHGADLSADMLAVAAERVGKLACLHHTDMRHLALGRTFSATVCLFSSIGYMQSETELHQAMANLAAHTEPGGVVLVEPWFTAQQWREHTVHRTTAEDNGRQLVRMSYSTTDGNHSIMQMHYLLGETGTGVTHWTDEHRMTLFSTAQYEEAFAAAGLAAVQWIAGWRQGRDRIIATKPPQV